MKNTVTIKFRAKLDTFSGGKGYKVPTLADRHIEFATRDSLTDEFNRTMSDPDKTAARLKAWTGGESLPGVVWADSDSLGAQTRDTSAWEVKPVGNGFMADVSITLPFGRNLN